MPHVRHLLPGTHLPLGKTGTLRTSLGMWAGISWHVFPKLQATLEKCAKCQGLITEHIVHALGKGYHPSCFSCAACSQAIGTESFAVDGQGDVYCVPDFYRLAMGKRLPHWELGSAHPCHPVGLTLLLFAPSGNMLQCAAPANIPLSPVRTRTPTRSSAWDAASMRAATAARYGPGGWGAPKVKGVALSLS